jgi:hypothetical protein
MFVFWGDFRLSTESTVATTTTKDILPFSGFTHSVVNFVDRIKPYRTKAFKLPIF